MDDPTDTAPAMTAAGLPKVAGKLCALCGGKQRWREMAVGETYDVSDIYDSHQTVAVHACIEGANTGKVFRTSKKTGRLLIRRLS